MPLAVSSADPRDSYLGRNRPGLLDLISPSPTIANSVSQSVDLTARSPQMAQLAAIGRSPLIYGLFDDVAPQPPSFAMCSKAPFSSVARNLKDESSTWNAPSCYRDVKGSVPNVIG
jgi:hypothetical protein